MALVIVGQTTISIDTVYQRVLALANKEQRGYITPQEFNLHANQAQLDIFEQYFYDLAAMNALNKRKEETESPGANVEVAPDFGDTVNILREKISIYKGTDVSLDVDGQTYIMPDLSASIYRTGRLYFEIGTDGAQIPLKRIEYYALPEIKELYDARTNSRWHSNDPIEYYYTENTNGSLSIYTESGGQTAVTTANALKIEVVAVVPRTVEWGYVVVGEKALYDSNNSVDFNLHRSEETNLVIKILELAGITINKLGLITVASSEEKQNIEQTQ
jgi:hypothetical protein